MPYSSISTSLMLMRWNERKSDTDSLALPVNVQDALEASKIAAALTHSFRSGKVVYFDQRGEAILE